MALTAGEDRSPFDNSIEMVSTIMLTKCQFIS